jgi:DNA-binding ferritin-like protein
MKKSISRNRKQNRPQIKTRKQTNKKKKTVYKHKKDNSSHIVKVFIEMLNMVKLYHWKTYSYAQHKATDELYSKMNEHIDSFVEIMLGKEESRIKMIEKKIELIDASNVLEFKKRIYEYRDFLIDMDLYFDKKKDTDLLSVRDELLGDINQFLYLLSFTK